IAFTDPYALTSPTVKKFDGTSWVTVGGAPVSTGQATYLDFAIDPSGVPYVFYTDYSVSNKGTVKKFDGTNWVTVGPLGFTAGQCGSNSMVIDKTGVPYVCFNDAGNGGGVSVMKFNGSNWVYVGAPSCVRAGPYNMVLDTAGTPYFSCLSPTLAGISVLKYIAGNWSFVGDSNFVLPFGPSQLLIDKTNTPNLFYYNQTGHVVSRKFNGATWDSSSFFPILDIFPSFTMDSLGRTYMIYDDTSGVKLVVRRFNGNTWDLIGNANFTGGGATHRNIHFSNKGELYTSCTSAGVYVYKLVLDSTNAGITGTACSGGSANFYANGGQWYNWVGPGGFSSTAQNPVLNPVSSVQNGTYTVTISDTGCAAVKKINLIVKANPTVTLSSNSTTFCIGDNAVTLTGNPSGGTFTGAGVNGNTFDPAISGVGVFNIYYSYTNVFGCGNIDSLQMTVSGCSNINSIDQKEIEIYPNPFNTTITIGKVSSPANIKIKDVIGRFVYETHTETESTTINPGILQNGVYFIYIQNAQGTYTQKLLKQ
ncbi:MAG: T9SS type A sorting domain-containing protein, partial [Bacteroidia bacterium]